MALMNSVGLHKEAIAAYEKFGVLCDYYGEEHDCGSAEVVAAWEQRRLLRRMDRSPAHHKLGGGDVSFLVGQLGLAYEHLKNIEKLRALVEENRGMRPTYAVGSLVKVLLSRGSAEDVEEAEELVQSFLEGGQDLRLISCWLEVQAKKGVDFDTAKTGLENWCRSCNSIVRPDVYCMFYLLKCKTKTEDSRPKADFLLSYIDDWDAIPRKEHLGAFLQCLLAVEEETAAVKFAEKHCRFADAAEKAIAACRPSLQRNAGPEDGGGRRGRVGSRGSVLRRGAGSGKEKGKDARRGGAGRGKGKDRGARRTNANGRKRKEKKERRKTADEEADEEKEKDRPKSSKESSSSRHKSKSHKSRGKRTDSEVEEDGGKRGLALSSIGAEVAAQAKEVEEMKKHKSKNKNIMRSVVEEAAAKAGKRSPSRQASATKGSRTELEAPRSKHKHRKSMDETALLTESGEVLMEGTAAKETSSGSRVIPGLDLSSKEAKAKLKSVLTGSGKRVPNTDRDAAAVETTASSSATATAQAAVGSILGSLNRVGRALPGPISTDAHRKEAGQVMLSMANEVQELKARIEALEAEKEQQDVALQGKEKTQALLQQQVVEMAQQIVVFQQAEQRRAMEERLRIAAQQEVAERANTRRTRSTDLAILLDPVAASKRRGYLYCLRMVMLILFLMLVRELF
mmetsp:Transcript_9905/g.40126  ORF Transcript_9905/g.40126 Transcript_9905/m.40126 type:complete len:681 (+) Transcript_9905:843-2885(+)